MAKLLDIVQYKDPILRSKAVSVDTIDGQLIEFMEDMTETMFLSRGIGLAAPQVSRSIRLIVVSDESGRVWKMINPELKTSRGSIVMQEGCLSIPGVYIPLVRPEKIELQYTDETQKLIVEKFDGLVSRVVQHEIDHLDGKLIIDKFDPEHRKWILQNLHTFVRPTNVAIG